MAEGRRRETRELLLSHGAVIARLFDEAPLAVNQIELFLNHGTFGEPVDTREPFRPGVHEAVHKILANGNRVPRELLEG